MTRHILFGMLATTTLLIGTANADFVNKPPFTFNGGVFECSVVSHTSETNDRDPVYKINVNVSLNDSGGVTSIGVVHTVRSGTTYDRSAQYSGGSIWQTPGRSEWNWNGRRGNVNMTGKLYHNDQDGWMYSEQIVQNGYKIYAMLSDCHEVQGE